jgi:hypothetical protein
MKFREEQTQAIRELYKEFMDKNLPLMFSCYKPMWLHPKDLKLRREKEYNELTGPAIEINKGDPYVTAAYNKSFDLGMDLLENGTYWPMFINDRGPKYGYYVREGNHRMAAIHILLEKGLWHEDRKVFCLVYEKNVYDPSYKLKEPLIMWKIQQNPDKHFDYKLVEHKVETAPDVMWTFNNATPYFRNFFWACDERVEADPRINDYEKYKEYWQGLDEFKELER